jgi:hypothetical protein
MRSPQISGQYITAFENIESTSASEFEFGCLYKSDQTQISGELSAEATRNNHSQETTRIGVPAPE